jgi:hypothetical protein
MRAGDGAGVARRSALATVTASGTKFSESAVRRGSTAATPMLPGIRIAALGHVSFLLLSASATVVLGLLWLLRSASDSAPVTWRHLVITALLFAASAVLIAYLI